MRESCAKCVLKHLAQASVLLDESLLGYPEHKWLAVGHLAEAESEALGLDEALANGIRQVRLDVIERGSIGYEPITQLRNVILFLDEK